MSVFAAPRLRTASSQSQGATVVSIPLIVCDESEPTWEVPYASIQGLGGDVLVAYAAFVVSRRMTRLWLNDTVQYLHDIADDIGIGDVSLVRLTVGAAEGRTATLN